MGGNPHHGLRKGGRVAAGLGMLSYGEAGRLRYGRVCCVLVGQVRQVKAVKDGMAWRGQARQGLAVLVGFGQVRYGQSWSGGFGMVRSVRAT